MIKRIIHRKKFNTLSQIEDTYCETIYKTLSKTGLLECV